MIGCLIAALVGFLCGLLCLLYFKMRLAALETTLREMQAEIERLHQPLYIKFGDAVVVNDEGH